MSRYILNYSKLDAQSWSLNWIESLFWLHLMYYTWVADPLIVVCYLCLPFISNPTTGQMNMPQLMSSYLSPLAFLLSPSHSGLSVKFSSFISCRRSRHINMQIIQHQTKDKRTVCMQVSTTSALTHLGPADVNYSFSIGSLSGLIQKVFNDNIFVIEPETQQGHAFRA